MSDQSKTKIVIINNGKKLHDAILADNLAVVKEIIRTKYNINKPYKGNYPLFVAIERDGLVLDYLLTLSSLDLSVIDNGYNALHYSVVKGNLKMVKYIIDYGVNINNLNDDGCTVLTMAINYGHYDIALYLVQSGIEIASIDLIKISDNYDSFNETRALFDLMFKQKQTPTSDDDIYVILSKIVDCNKDDNIEILVRYHMDAVIRVVNRHDNSKDTLLHDAAIEDKYGSVKELLKIGADPNAINIKGNTPLHSLIIHYYSDYCVIDLLLKAGANKTIKNNKGKTPGDLARDNEDDELVEYLQNYQSVEDIKEPEFL